MLAPSERLKEINNLFLRKAFAVNYLSVKQYLSEYFDVSNYSERSFSRDLNALRELVGLRYPSLEEESGDLIRYSRARNCFYYIRQDISAFPSFSEKELNQLASVIDLNQHLFTDGAGQGIVNKLRAISLENSLSAHQQVNHWPIIQLIKDGERSGSENIKPLLEAIAAKNVIEFDYQSLSKSAQSKPYMGIPLLIKEYNNGWYTGWYVLLQEINPMEKIRQTHINSLRLFALDRMKELHVSKHSCRLRFAPEFNPSDYFKHTLGILRNNLLVPELKPAHVSVEIHQDNWILEYLSQYPLHFSQKMMNHPSKKEYVLISWKLEINVELESFLMQYAAELKVLSPSSLQSSIQLKLREAMERYES